MANAFIPYGIYWSTPFAKWQGTLANMHSLKLADGSASGDSGMTLVSRVSDSKR